MIFIHQPKITHLRIIGQFKVNLQLLEIFSFFAETSERSALEELSETITACFKEEELYKACYNLDDNHSLSNTGVQYLTELFLSTEDVSDQWFYPNIVKGLQYLINEIKTTIETETKIINYSKLVSIHLAFPARFEVWFAIPTKETCLWLGTS